MVLNNKRREDFAVLIDLKDFMTEEEKNQVNLILDRAEGRMQRQQRQQTNAYQLLECQCRVYEQMPENGRRPGGSCMADMQELLMMICQFCREHGCCQCREGEEREEGEELPF